MKLKTAYTLLVLSVAAGVMIPLSACTGMSHDDTNKTAQAMPEENFAMAATGTVKTLQIEDVKVGNGPEAKKGQTITVNYRGTLFSNGKEFDSSYERQEPFTFKLGAGQVIEGWDQGIAGMKVGGKRILVIPPAQAYGAEGHPPVIPQNATLKFEVELLGVK